MHYLHDYCNIIHTDLKPENIMICLSQEEIAHLINNNTI